MSEDTWETLLSEQIRQNGRLFYQLAYRILRDGAAAEDVCQQALLRAWEERENIDGGGQALKSWLARTVVNCGLQIVRRGKIERRVMANHAGARAGTYPGGEADVSAPWAREELRAEVLAALDRLPESVRLVVVLRQLQGMSGNEVKDLLGCSAAEVSRQLHRGLEQLRCLLAHHGPGGADPRDTESGAEADKPACPL